MEGLLPGSGPLICQGTNASDGQPCTHHEIDGLGYCFPHLPDDLLDEAEDITGARRCRKRFGDPDACHCFAVAGTTPPMCKNHGANAGSHQGKIAAGHVVTGRVTDRMVAIMGDHGEALMTPDPIGDPLSELLAVAAEIRTWKEIMRGVVADLLSRQVIRYTNRSYGEQLRAEVLLYERALERLAAILVQIGKLGIERKLAQIQADQVSMVDRALSAALTASGLGLEAQQEARAVLVRELRKAG
jgi:hypothetical protein